MMHCHDDSTTKIGNKYINMQLKLSGIDSYKIMEEIKVSMMVVNYVTKAGESKHSDFTSLNNGIPLLFWTGIATILWIITILYYENKYIRSFLILFF
jgi:hypothetical protein